MGNGECGTDISLRQLSDYYDVIVLAYGASQDTALGIPGEDLDGVFSARAFVGWYNGLPEYSHLAPKLDSSDAAVIVGNGNVALDVARILLTNHNKLETTDIARGALESLRRSSIKRVHVVGRRGPLQASFTIKEVRELFELPQVGFRPIPRELLPGPDVQLPRAPRRMSDLLRRSKTPRGDEIRSWTLNFLRSPIRFNGAVRSPSSLGSVDLMHNRFVEGQDPFSATTRVEPTGEVSAMSTSLAFRSVGYKATPIPGMDEVGIHLQKALGRIPNSDGRVMANERFLDGWYCAGWVKSGPTGVIARTMADAFATADVIANDWAGRTSN